MPLSLPHTTPANWPPLDAGRFASTIVTESPDGCQVALLGLADDLGVKLNRGRPGAREGPAAFRAALGGFGATWDGLAGHSLDVKVFDAGDIQPAQGEDEAALLETHARVEAVARQLHEMGLVVVGIGGGHDLTLPTVSALAKHVGGPVGGVNFDAHLDVRQRAGSGMPFRRLIEAGHLHGPAFVEVGLGRFSNSGEDLAWLREQGATLVMAENVEGPELIRKISLDIAIRYLPGGAALEDLPGGAGPLGAAMAGVDGASGGGASSAHSPAAFVSIDLDGIDASAAPGVSAINPAGLSVRHAAVLAEAAGREGRVRHFDLMELSPPHDVDGRTARVAALLFMSFIAGFTGRIR